MHKICCHTELERTYSREGRNPAAAPRILFGILVFEAKGDKRLEVCSDFVRLREVSLENITSDEGILLRVNRSIMSEGAFGIIKEDWNFR